MQAFPGDPATMGDLTDEFKKIPAWGWLAAAIIVVGAIIAIRRSKANASQTTDTQQPAPDANAGVQGDVATMTLEELTNIEHLLAAQSQTQNNAAANAGNNGSPVAPLRPACPPGEVAVPVAMGVDSKFPFHFGWRCVPEPHFNPSTSPIPVQFGGTVGGVIHSIPEATAPATSTGSRTYTVVHGDTLWSIAQRMYGNGALWPKIYAANKGTIGSNPNLIFAGQHYTIPAK